MKVSKIHAWDLTPKEAIALQKRLASRVRLARASCGAWRRVAGADVAVSREAGLLVAGVVVLRLPEFEVVEEVTVEKALSFPYVPGLLSFRELPALLDAFERVRGPVDAVICDGQGIAHPRRLGLASHLGLFLGMPTVGSAKSRLVGEHRKTIGRRRGSRAALTMGGDVVGSVLRTRDGVKPLYVSPGHLMDVESATELVLAACTRYRLPEPQRLADQLVGRTKRARTLP